MGKRKLENYDQIEDKAGRNVTYSKRKKGVIKKAMELSHLCAQEILLVMFNKKNQKLVIYQSSEDFSPVRV